MPQLKKSRRARNLGAYSKPRVKAEPTNSPPRHQSPPPIQPNPPEDVSPSPEPSTSTPLPISYFSIYRPPPLPVVKCAIPALEERVNPKRKSGVGHTKSKLTPLALRDLNSVLELFRTYTGKDITWEQAAKDVALGQGLGEGHSRTLRTWARACILDPSFTPRTSYGHSQDPLIEYDEFRKLLSKHLLSVGKYVTTANVIQFTARADIQEEWGLTKPVSKTTAKRWMHYLKYQWGRVPKGMYLDGHERPDVVEYRQGVYVKTWKRLEPRMESFATFVGTFEPKLHMDPIIRRIVAWFHDECTFHAHDRRMLIWALMLASRDPTKKGEGIPLMVSDLISAEYGWMASPDGNDRVRELFSPGKNREGYFSTSHICKQIAHAADILAEYYPGEDHVFIFDNSPTHRKRGAGAPSALGMPKFTPKSNNFLVETTDEDGNKVKVQMTGGYLHNGEPQSFYWPEGHERAGWFKGMAEIVKERGWENAYQIRAECKKHNDTRTDCCLRRILFNEPDFASPTSILERLVTSRGHGFLLLPKFHPELNPIEQCWAKAKRVFREFPESTGTRQLEKFVVTALDSVSLSDIRKFCTRSRRVVDGYAKGLDGRLSIWAMRLYHGHREYPETIMEEVEEEIRQA